MDFITIDFETADRFRDSACEIGLTFVENFNITETKSWLIKPGCYPIFDPYNIHVHKIKPSEVANAPNFCELWPEIHPLIENQLLIAHNASFDLSVLRTTLDYYGLEYPELMYSCSYLFSKNVWQGLSGYGLEALCNYHDIDLRHHRAGPDSRATAELVIQAFEFAGVNSIDDFPEKLQMKIGRLFPGGYLPSGKVKARRTKKMV
ncbi:3'-5' exonuclease [Alkalitalea saponilacus]|uniref:DNA polymerase-3 subunit epsilon n=1 Tax=Alkalitalea saponilacus TaxID=889453 RepID=A0A1T5HN04_9BACT|nr:3'-5' exonuclease [Alkalitalea saponilacus]ASB49365.1 DNA polymerase III subunit epsilon [Alkalitalea saponilacus]SKC22063.1 DNA polymerase-3 subunit epsilon [Alkalitalea saponilacus]